MLRRRDIPLIYVEQEFWTDAEDCTFIVRGVRPERRQAVLDALKDVPGFMEMRVVKREVAFYDGERVGDIVIGVSEWEVADKDYGLSRVRATLERLFLRTRIRQRTIHPYRGDSIAEGIWGKDWEDHIALTEEEREVLGRKRFRSLE